MVLLIGVEIANDVAEIGQRVRVIGPILPINGKDLYRVLRFFQSGLASWKWQEE